MRYLCKTGVSYLKFCKEKRFFLLIRFINGDLHNSVIVAWFSMFSHHITLVLSFYLTSLFCLQNKQVFSKSFYPVMCWVLQEKCSVEFNISAHQLTGTGLEHAFAVDGSVSKQFCFDFKEKYYLCASFQAKNCSMDTGLFLRWNKTLSSCHHSFVCVSLSPLLFLYRQCREAGFLHAYSHTFIFIFTFTHFRTFRDKCDSVTKWIYRYYNISFTLTKVRTALDLYQHTWKETSYLLWWAFYPGE